MSLFIAPRPALASRFFFEFGGGTSRLGETASLFHQSKPLNLGFGSILQFTLAVQVASEPVGIHLGLQHRIHQSAQSGTSYGVQSLYPIIEFDLYHAYANLGFTPLIWQRARNDSGFDYYSGSGALGFLGEIGVSLPITYEIAFNVAGSAEYVTHGGSASPAPALAGVASFRLFFGNSRGTQSDGVPRVRGDYKGYRYPYGQELSR